MPCDYDLVGLDKLPYARGVRAEPSKRCLPGTRVELLRKIQDWALNPVANRVYLLQGTAGKGKTAVAHTVALSLQEAGVVTPFFAFNRYDQERAAHQVLPTLARQLAERNKLYSQYLCDQPPSLLESRDPATQVQCLIRGGLGDCTVGAPIVFVIDALDECSDARVQAEDRRNMLERLRNCLVDSRLPSNVRFFLTYRPDEDIIRCLAQPIVQATRLSIDKVDGTESDIRAFVKFRLANTHFCDKVHTVAFAAQTLFQSAAASTRPRRSCVFSLAYSPNGRHIALGLNNSVGVWDRESGRSREGAVEGIAFTPNGRIMASSAMDGIIRIWDMRMPERLRELNRWYSRASLAFSPDGKYVAMASRLDNLMLWDLEHNRCIAKAEAQTRDCIGRIRSMAYSPEGSYIACGTSCGAMWLWNLKTALLFEAGSTTFETRNSAIVSVVFSPNGKTVASISQDSTLQHWDTDSSRLQSGSAIWLCRLTITCVAISSNGKFIAVGLGCGTLRIWDAETLAQVGHDLVGDEERIRSVAFSPDSARVASSSTVVRIWDVETQRQHGDDFRLSSRSAHCMVFSPDGRCIVSGFSDGTVRTWDTVENCQVGDPLRLEEEIVCIALSPDGLLIACGSMDGVLRICSVVWGQQIWSIAEDGDSGPIVSVAFSSDGARIAYCSRSAVHLVDMDTRTEVGRYVHSNVRSVAFALDDTHIVFGGSHHYAGVWNPAKEGEEACVALYGHRGDVTGVATTRQGTTIVTCSSDSTIRLWDLAHLTSLSRNGAEPISESDLATERRQLHTRQIGGWLYHDRLSRFGDPPLDLKENWASDESCAPFLWIPPRIRRFFPSVYSPFARGVISAYPSFTVSLDNDECLDQWAITYTPPPDHMMEQEMEEDEGEGVVDAV
ncbi:WD40-repeat-containing domain protein [Schizophyllum commune]